MSFNLNMEFCVISKKRPDRLSDDILFAAPVPVGAYHLAKLRAVISQMIYSESVISQKIIYLVYRIAYNRTSDMSDMKRFCNVRRGILYYYFSACSYVR